MLVMTLERLYLSEEATKATLEKDGHKTHCVSDNKQIDLWEKRQLKTKRKLKQSLEKLMQQI